MAEPRHLQTRVIGFGTEALERNGISASQRGGRDSVGHNNMSFFGARRARQTRVFRPTPSAWEKLATAFQDYRVLTLWLVALFAILMLLLSVQSWQTRFPYREGQISRSGIQARVDFQIENVRATEQARAQARANAPLVFLYDDSVLEKIRAAFKSDLTLIANATAIGDLDRNTVEAFQLQTEIPGDVEKAIDPSTRFDQMRLAMTDSEMAIALRVEQMALEFAQLLELADEPGILNIDELKAIELPNHVGEVDSLQPIEIIDPEGNVLSQDRLVDVIMADQMLETGRLGSQWRQLPNLQQIRPAVESWLARRLRGQLTYDRDRTATRQEQSAELVEPQFDSYNVGRTLVPTGTMLTPTELELLVHEHSAYDAQVGFGQRMLSVVGAALLISGMVALFGLYIYRNEPRLLEETGQLIALVIICAAAVMLGSWFSRDPWRAEVMPLLAAVMIIAIVHNQMLAVLSAFCLSVLITMSTTVSLTHFAVMMLLSFIVVIPLKNISSRSVLIKAGFLLAVIGFGAVWSMNLIDSHNFAEAWKNETMLLVAVKFGFWSLVCCFLVHGGLPFIESAFGIVTDISLLELSDVSHPLLQELARRAPGTYNHSVTVATIGEAAADAVGANGLLLRVGAYFHDIGKMVKPEYFIENMTEGQENPHDKLAPAMSVLIIIGHVKDGVEMAEQHNMPRRLIDFIEQHHGTTLVEYFFREATNRADEDHRTDADESAFRYPGPRPQTKETGVMMLADAIESASRSLSEPTPKRIQSLVKEITLKRVLDGQFDDCGLTMSEIAVIQDSLVKSLLAVHHGRIKYPDQKTA